ncbi:unnamed protein product [Nesidiocoris tenuis]|uniref:AMP-dependent synthetase/ligase domain-containing protein n=1 Tax=Nesidiocoris tenuis TaxID=355587 RepID=A0A6H5GUN9_9HEMI|nr:unnamed protein product [Nesidiocoris tenuis]
MPQFAGAVPVTIRPPHPQNLQTTLPTVRMIVDVSKSVLVLSNQNVIKLLRSKEASNVVDIKSWPVILDTDDMPKKKLTAMYRAPTAEMLAYLDFSVSTTGMLAGIKMSHAAVTSLCRSMKLACELYPSRHIALCLDPYCGLGFALWCLSSPEPSSVYVDLRALRNDRVTLVERGSPHSLCLLESGKLLPGVKVIIANPETKGQCGDSHLGEIWVQSPHSASGYFSIYGDESEYNEHFNARLVTGNTGEVYARTGYLGFLRRTENLNQTSSTNTNTTQSSVLSEVTDLTSLHDLSALNRNTSQTDTSGKEMSKLSSQALLFNRSSPGRALPPVNLDAAIRAKLMMFSRLQNCKTPFSSSALWTRRSCSAA